ncbi:MAG: hypothetical protein ABJC10_14150 [Acidobacteriota bacterium]
MSIPYEDKLIEDEGLPAELEADLQKRVKALRLWAPNLPSEWGGMGIGTSAPSWLTR